MTTEDELEDLRTNDKYSLNEFLANQSNNSQGYSPSIQINSWQTKHDLLNVEKPRNKKRKLSRPMSGVAQNCLSKLERIYANPQQLVIPQEYEADDLSPQPASTIDPTQTSLTHH